MNIKIDNNYFVNKATPNDNYIFCAQCAAYVFEFCSLHGPHLIVPDNEVKSKSPTVPRSALTIPNVFLHLAPSIITGAGLGVFSSVTIPIGVRFGPYRGVLGDEVKSMYCWQINAPDNSSHVIDAEDHNTSNWLRYVNCSRNWHEQNLVAHQYRGKIYYSTIKVIPKFTELLVFYGIEFANLLDIDLRKYNKENVSLHKIDVLNNDGDSRNKINTIIEDELPEDYNKPADISMSTQKSCVFEVSKTHALENSDQINCDKSILPDSQIPVSNNRIKCRICGRSFKENRYLRRHELTHLSTKLHNCTFCDFATNILRNLKDHISCKHTKENIYQCIFCSNQYFAKHSFQRHLRDHIRKNKMETLVN